MHATRTPVSVRGEVRCSSCARLLVLRSGPAITPHYAHRPRQSCRDGHGRGADSVLRTEQLTLFDLEPVPALAGPAPSAGSGDVTAGERPRAVEGGEAEPVAAATMSDHQSVRPARRRRRRAWLPRLVGWLKTRTHPV
jgi:hypothetical protein